MVTGGRALATPGAARSEAARLSVAIRNRVRALPRSGEAEVETDERAPGDVEREHQGHQAILDLRIVRRANRFFDVIKPEPGPFEAPRRCFP